MLCAMELGRKILKIKIHRNIILLLVLCGYEPRSVAGETRIAKKIFGSHRDDISTQV